MTSLAEDLAYEATQHTQHKLEVYVQALVEEFRMRDFSHDECMTIDSDLTRDLEVEAVRVLESTVDHLLSERPDPEEDVDVDMTDATKEWVRNQLVLYGNVILTVEDGELLPGLDFAEMNTVLSSAESTLTKVRDSLMKKANEG